MTKIAARIINAFVDDGRGGNPAGVILNANTLTRAKVSREFEIEI